MASAPFDQSPEFQPRSLSYSGTEEDAYAFVRDTDKPDRNVEYFWYLFKAVVANMGRDEHLGRDFLNLPPEIVPHAMSVKRPTLGSQVDQISAHLNALQKEKAYNSIQSIIVDVYEDLACALLEKGSPAKISVERLLTFAKRWDEWADADFAMRPTSPYVAMLHISLVGFRCTKDQRAVLFSLLAEAASAPEYFLGDLFDCGVRFGRPSILDRVSSMGDMTGHIKSCYGLKVSPRTKGFKLLKSLQKVSEEKVYGGTHL